jgi:hypothetical protein
MMAEHDALATLVQDVRDGGNPKLQRLAAEGALPLPPLEIVSLQVELAANAEQSIASLAAASLQQLDPATAAAVIGESTTSDIAVSLARILDHPVVLESIIRRRDIPPEILIDLGPKLPTNLQEVLLVRQDAIVRSPEILDALEKNPQLTDFARRRIHEYREHLIEDAFAPKPGKQDTSDAAIDQISDADLNQALIEVKAEKPGGEFDEVTGLSENQVRFLTLPMRLRLSRGATPGLRRVLIKDPNPMVAMSVLNFNPLSDSEIELVAKSRTVVEEVLSAIGKDRKWVRKYNVVRALVGNPRTPIGLAVRLAASLSVRDLKAFSMDRQIPDAVRARAKQLYRLKFR